MPEGEHTFRMRGGPVNGELATFALDDAGTVTELKAGSFTFQRQ